MKVGELRTKLSKLKKDQVVKLAAGFYKLIPKDKRIDSGIDALVDNPDGNLRKAAKSTALSLDEIEQDVQDFLDHAREQYYLAPNQCMSTWMNTKRLYNSSKPITISIEKRSNFMY